MLVTSCIDNNYDLSEIDTDGVVIGDEFRLPLATVTVSMSELSKEGTDIKALFDEADIWLPSPLPAGGKYVDLQKIQHTPSYIDELLDELMKLDEFKKAYFEEGLKPEAFEHYGAFLATMNQFLGGYDDLVRLIRSYMIK